MEDCAVTLRTLGPEVVIITGGHTSSGADLLYDGEDFVRIEGPVYPSENTHGAGCTYSSALASFLAHGFGPVEAARRAHAIASEAVEYGLGEIGRGAGPVHALGRVLKGVEE
jgi:hydroxymethylpyrimidine/phosphomethylpyrimidine kinase